MKIRAWSSCISLVILLGCAGSKSSTLPGNNNLPLCWVAAHRGDTSSALGNSAVAIMKAAHARIPLIEVDVRRIADGSLVLHHDRRLLPGCCNGSRYEGQEVSALNSDQIRSVRRGDAQVPIISLRHALRLINEHTATLLLDLKQSDTTMLEELAAVITQTRSNNRVIAQCQSSECESLLRSRIPGIVILRRAKSPTEMESFFNNKAAIVQGDFEWVSTALVAQARENGSRVLVRVSETDHDNPAGWQQLVERGVDIIMSDHAKELSGFLATSCK